MRHFCQRAHHDNSAMGQLQAVDHGTAGEPLRDWSDHCLARLRIDVSTSGIPGRVALVDSRSAAAPGPFVEGWEKLFDLKEAADFVRLINSQRTESRDENVRFDVSEHSTPEIRPKARGAVLFEDHEDPQQLPSPLPSARKIWIDFLAAEEELRPTVQLTEDARYDEKTGRIYAAHEDDVDVESLEDRDTVLSRDRVLGHLDLRHSDANQIVFWPGEKTRRIPVGAQLSIRSERAYSSFKRRRNAIMRAINNQTPIATLPDYFDADCSKRPILTTSRIFDKGTADVYGLNESQTEALCRLWNNGPISFLQGPPGTGKTTFIAAFIHFALTSGGARNVLLASQSHEAVDGAAEKVLSRMQQTGRSIDIIRVANDVSKVTDALKPVHAETLQQRLLSRFQAERPERIRQLARALGLRGDFIADALRLHDAPFRTARTLERLSAGELEDEDASVAARKRRTLDAALERQCAAYDCFDPGPGVPNRAQRILYSGLDALAERYRVDDRDAVSRLMRLIDLSDDWQEALQAPRRTLESFFVEKSTLVCGTCVGLGDGKLNIQEKVFDLVVVDEAARSTASELMVPLQTARKVLLVGDHMQLLPQLSQEVIESVAAVNDVRPEYLRKSDFARAFDSSYGTSASSILETQYRMAPKIGGLVSEVFYQGRLKTGRPVAESHYDALRWPLDDECAWVDVPRTSSERRRKYSFVNEAEAEEIVRILEYLSKEDVFVEVALSRLNPEEYLVGVICMYAEQRDLMEARLATAAIPAEFRCRIKVGTVDSYQGKENRIVIVSLVRNNDRRNIGFLKAENRVNVALSRAMDRLVIVGSAEMFRQGESALCEVLERLSREERVGPLRALELSGS